jgi:hypothetical protein
MFSFVDKYVSLAGRSCCCGRSWEGLNRSLARRADDPVARDCHDTPTFVASDDPHGVFVDADREPDEATFATSSSTQR